MHSQVSLWKKACAHWLETRSRLRVSLVKPSWGSYLKELHPGGAPEGCAGCPSSGLMQVDQWLAFVHTEVTPIIDDKLAEVNAWLSSRTSLIGNYWLLAWKLVAQS
jgi:hypothetical protein